MQKSLVLCTDKCYEPMRRRANIRILTTCRTCKARANHTVPTRVLQVYHMVYTHATCVIRSSKLGVQSTQGVIAGPVQCMCRVIPISLRLFTLRWWSEPWKKASLAAGHMGYYAWSTIEKCTGTGTAQTLHLHIAKYAIASLLLTTHVACACNVW